VPWLKVVRELRILIRLNTSLAGDAPLEADILAIFGNQRMCHALGGGPSPKTSGDILASHRNLSLPQANPIMFSRTHPKHIGPHKLGETPHLYRLEL
jgi:hypothetical protein